jgi:prepilin-type N-terminal cleavage/methylation domain-containing protein
MFNTSYRSVTSSRGFTLIELLVVISIIGILASVVLGSMERARSLSRDTNRMATLSQIQKAMELYRNEHGTYQVVGGGSAGGGQGYFAYEGGGYPVAVSRVLYNEGYLGQSIVDDPRTTPGYMIYVCGGGSSYAVSATLENPSPEHIAHIQTTCNGVGANGTYSRYGKNYAVTNPL